MKDWQILLIFLACCSAPVLLGLLVLKGVERMRIRCPTIPRSIQRLADTVRKCITAAAIGAISLAFLAFFIWIIKTIWYLV